MDRIALSKRIKGLSEVFASDNEIAQDLSAMSYVLSNMSEEKFSSIINPEVGTDKEGAGIPFSTSQGQAGPVKLQDISKHEEMSGDPTPQGIPSTVVNAEEERNEDVMSDKKGMYWNKAASEAVADALLRDVVGMDKSICCDTKRHLDKEQLPDSEKKQQTPPTLKGEQIPVNKENHKSGIVEKAQAAKALHKSAAEDSETCEEETKAIEKIEEGLEELKKIEKKEKKDGESGEHEEVEEEAIEEIEDAVEDIKDSEKDEDKEEGKDEDSDEDKDEDKEEDGDEDKDDDKEEKDALDSSFIQSEGVELIAPMSEVKLSSGDKAELGKLFD